MTTEILILLLMFQIKHLIADYYLQFPYMYENKGKKTNWIEPLSNHAGVHALGTLFIVLPYFIYTGIPDKISGTIAGFYILGIMMFDFVTHFITDRWKATRKQDPSQKQFWKSLGIDQMIHHIVGILIIWYIV